MRPAGYGALAKAVLFLVTAVATGWQVSRFMMWGVWGKPADPLEFVAIAGSWVLVYGAAAAYDGAIRKTTIGAGLGCVLLWVFYARAIWTTARATSSGTAVVDPLAFVPPALLIASTLVVVQSLFRGNS
jgi:hypothetical protein